MTIAVVDASSADAYDSVADQTVTVTTTDNDTASITLSTTTATVSEAGSTGTFTAVLDVQPAGGSWSGTTGTVTTADAMTGGDPGGGMSWIRLPTGDLMRFSIGGNDTFWLYAYLNGFQTGRLTSSGNCGMGKGYEGFDSLSDITNAAAYTFDTGYPNLFVGTCLLYTSPSPRDKRQSRMPSSA